MKTLALSDTEKPNGIAEASLPAEEHWLFRSRQVLIFGQIDEKLAQSTCRRLLALSAAGDAPITCIVSSPGGHGKSGDAIHDVVRFIRAPVMS